MTGRRTIIRLQTITVIALLASIAVIACGGGPATARVGNTVSVLYNGTFDNGSVFDSSEMHDNEPLEFTIGAGQVIPGFDQAVIGMGINESKDVHIPMEQAYGPYYEDMIITFNWSDLPEGLETDIGEQIPLQNMYGQTLWATVIDISDEGITVDANHPLAGLDLNFNITLVEIK